MQALQIPRINERHILHKLEIRERETHTPNQRSVMLPGSAPVRTSWVTKSSQCTQRKSP